jgi:hypothetical protein
MALKVDDLLRTLVVMMPESVRFFPGINVGASDARPSETHHDSLIVLIGARPRG